jgi:hypothetical protein
MCWPTFPNPTVLAFFQTIFMKAYANALSEALEELLRVATFVEPTSHALVAAPSA